MRRRVVFDSVFVTVFDFGRCRFYIVFFVVGLSVGVELKVPRFVVFTVSTFFYLSER